MTMRAVSAAGPVVTAARRSTLARYSDRRKLIDPERDQDDVSERCAPTPSRLLEHRLTLLDTPTSCCCCCWCRRMCSDIVSWSISEAANRNCPNASSCNTSVSCGDGTRSTTEHLFLSVFSIYETISNNFAICTNKILGKSQFCTQKIPKIVQYSPCSARCSL